MTFSPTSKQVVLKETFDESSNPTDEEIQEYAIKIGINVEEESYFLPLARDCLMQALPVDWSPCYDADYPDRIYYFNFKTRRAQWIHPLEETHRQLVLRAKAEVKLESGSNDDDSRTTVKEELKSYEEGLESLESQLSAMIPKPKYLEPMRPKPIKGGLRKPPDTLGPLKIAAPAPDVKKVSFNDCEVKKRPNSSDIRNRRIIEPVEFRHLSNQEIITPKTQWRDEGYITGTDSLTQPALVLSGGGNAFLKKSAKALETVPKNAKKLEKDDSSNTEDEKNSVSLKIEKELKINFQVPMTQVVSQTPSEHSKQNEIDFEDLLLDGDEIKVPKVERESQECENSKGGLDIFAKIRPATGLRNLPVSKIVTLDGKENMHVDERAETVEHELKTNKKDVMPENEKQEEPSDGFTKVKITFNEREHAPMRKIDLIDFTDESLSSIDDASIAKKARSILLDLKKFEESDNILKTDEKIFTNDLKAMNNIKNVSIENYKNSQEVFLPPRNEERRDIDRTKENLEMAKADKQKALEGDFNDWVKSTEKMFREKEKQCYGNMQERFEEWRKRQENGVLKQMSDESEQLQAKVNDLKKELLLQEKEAIEEVRRSLAEQTRERLRVLRAEIEEREATELAELKKTLDSELAEKKAQLAKQHKDQMARLEQGLESMIAEQRRLRDLELEKVREDESALAAQRAQLKDAFLQQKSVAQQEHEMALHKLRQQHELELVQAANERTSVEGEKKEVTDPRVFEKLRCEKRLLEDKYKSLKEKYIRLKSDVKLTLVERKVVTKKPLSDGEKPKKKAEPPAIEVETLKSQKSSRLPETTVSRGTESAKTHLDNINQNVAEDLAKNALGELSPLAGVRAEIAEGSSGDECILDARAARKRRQMFSKLKAASTSKLNTSHRITQSDVMSPVENLRRQLKKLEELEDQFPVTPDTDTYLRYPFTDAPAPQFASSELEFFKHRIHLERDSVRRAKEFLKAQKKCYEKRQRELEHRLMDGAPTQPSRSIVDKIHQEERELTEMEVSVHRTRALLGEKIIRLRHLEHSLRRVTPTDRKQRGTAAGHPSRCVSREDGTLSDLSSHSDSSGFSSTHYTSEPAGPFLTVDKKRHVGGNSHMQESTEIIQSLEKLNTEIRGIWDVLKQSSSPGTVQLPPPPLAWPAVRTNPTEGLLSPRPLTQMKTQLSGVGHVTTIVDTSLVDRTKSLRDWLKSARRSPNNESLLSNQVTL